MFQEAGLGQEMGAAFPNAERLVALNKYFFGRVFAVEQLGKTPVSKLDPQIEAGRLACKSFKTGCST